MATGAATEGQVNKLHGLLAEVIGSQLGEQICVNQEAVDAEGAEPEMMYVASPALLTIAERFCNNAGAVTDVETVEATAEIDQQISRLRQGRGKVVSISDVALVAANG